MERVKLGIPGLDEILLGGIVKGNAILVEGTPGAGKTTLGMQFIHAGVTKFDEPGLIVTFEEFPSQMYRDAGQIGLDLRALADGNKLKIISTSPAVFRQETAGPTGLINSIAREIGAERVLVDSISHFQRLTQDPAEQREIFNSLVNMLKRAGFTAMFTKEVKQRTGDEVSFEEYVSDAAFRLSYEVEAGNHRSRYVEVVKARGQDFVAGKHNLVIGRGGVTVFPATPATTSDRDHPPAVIDKVSSGVAGLDEMLLGGVQRGSSTFLLGPAGSGKTIFGLQFVARAAELGEPGLYVSLRERAHQLKATAEQLNIPRGHGGVDIIFQAPAPLSPHVLVHGLVERIEAKRYQRVVLDSVDEIFGAFDDRSRALALLRYFIDELRRRNVTSVFVGGDSGDDRMGTIAGSPLAGLVDCLISLRFVETKGKVRLGLAILKSRGTAHSPDVRPYRITSEGLAVVTRRVTVYDDFEV